MADQPSYEFEDDTEAPKPARKPFIPGLEPVAAPVAQVAPGVPAAPSAAESPRPLAPLPPPPPQDESEDADLKPGSRKDLWRCPHCGAGNKPDRITCRSCSKSPSQPLDPKWWSKPQVWIGAGVGLLFVVVVWVLTRPDLSLHPAGPSSVDSAIRRGSLSRYDKDLNGKTFTGKGRLSVCGRVVASRPLAVDGVKAITVVLALGEAAQDGALDQVSVTFNGERVDATGHSVIVTLITDDAIDTTKGAYLSVIGDYGDLADGVMLIGNIEGGYTVLVDKLRQ